MFWCLLSIKFFKLCLIIYNKRNALKKRFCLKISSKYKIGILWAFRSNLLVYRLLYHATNLTFFIRIEENYLLNYQIPQRSNHSLSQNQSDAYFYWWLRCFQHLWNSSFLKVSLLWSWSYLYLECFLKTPFSTTFLNWPSPLKCWMFLEALSTLSKYCRPFVNAAQLILNLYIVYNQSANW